MSRIRTVKPELFKHEALFEAEEETGLPIRLAFIGLFTVCDKEGRFKWSPRAIKTDVMPYDDVDFSRVLDALATRGFVVRYAHKGREYGVIPTFRTHQHINNREQDSQLPEPPDECEQQSENKSKSTREARVNDASGTRQARDGDAPSGEGKGREGKGKGTTTTNCTSERRDAREDRPEDGGGGDPSEFRTAILEAMGVDDPETGQHGPSGKLYGNATEMLAAHRWRDDLGLSDREILVVIRSVMDARRAKGESGPPSTLAYFDKPMERHAGAKSRRLTPDTSGGGGGRGGMLEQIKRERAAREYAASLGIEL